MADNGPGIKPEVRRRLFAEPFFTTKVRHRGLGLAVCYRILCAHRGGIQLSPVAAPGTGTQVRVVLPLADLPWRMAVRNGGWRARVHAAFGPGWTAVK